MMRRSHPVWAIPVVSRSPGPLKWVQPAGARSSTNRSPGRPAMVKSADAVSLFVTMIHGRPLLKQRARARCFSLLLRYWMHSQMHSQTHFASVLLGQQLASRTRDGRADQERKNLEALTTEL